MPATKQARENKSLNIYLPRFEHTDAMLDMFMREDQRLFLIVRAHRFGVPIYEYCGGISTNDYGVKQDTISCVFFNLKACDCFVNHEVTGRWTY